MLSPSDLLSQPEGKTLEFKRDLSSPKNILKTIVAFANTAGGRIIIGVEDTTRMVTGIVDPFGEEERLCSLIADSIVPRLVPDVDLISIEDQTLLMVQVYPSGQRPHFLKKEGPVEGVYVRLGSTNRKADRELIAELNRSCSGISFDEMPMPELSEDDLDLKAARKHFSGRRDLTREELLTLKLLAVDQKRYVPTHGAMLLYGKRRDFYFPDAWVQCGRFIGRDKVDIFDHIDIHDTLPDAVESIILFLKKHAMRGADFSEIRRKDVWSIPLTILREVIINALVHADYSQIGAPIRVSFFDDRIEVENPGILLPGMTIEDVKSGVSKIRNRVIARVFRELDLIEQWGSGFRRILQEASELGLSEPVIEEIGMRVRVTVFLSEELVIHTEGPSRNQVGTKSGLSPSGRDQVDLNDEQRMVLQKCIQESGIIDLMAVAQRTNRSKFREAVINPLLDKGLLEMTIPDKPNSSKQKYRITPKGKEILSIL
ncbi:ATP-binding protein [Methanospirillum sp.]